MQHNACIIYGCQLLSFSDSINNEAVDSITMDVCDKVTVLKVIGVLGKTKMLLHYIADVIETCGASTWKQIVCDIVAGQDMLKT